MDEKLQEQMHNFLLGNWNWSMDSVEGALQAILDEYTKDGLIEEIALIDAFFKSDESDEWKANFVVNNTGIYWPNMEESPLEWLGNVKSKLEEALKKE